MYIYSCPASYWPLIIFVDSQCTVWESSYCLVSMSVLVTRLITDCVLEGITPFYYSIVAAYRLYTVLITPAANNFYVKI